MMKTTRIFAPLAFGSVRCVCCLQSHFASYFYRLHEIGVNMNMYFPVRTIDFNMGDGHDVMSDNGSDATHDSALRAETERSL